MKIVRFWVLQPSPRRFIVPPMTTNHAAERTEERVQDLTSTIAPRIARFVQWSKQTGQSCAALVAIEKQARGDQSADIMNRESNGELVFAIVRDGRHITTFSRRKGQDLSASFFRVDRVLNGVKK